MTSLKQGFKSGEEGEGRSGCIFAIVLIVIAAFLAVTLGPPYYSHYGFRSDLQHLVSREGARASSDESVRRQLIRLAEQNNILLEANNIRISRFASQLTISVEYTIPVSFIFVKRDLLFSTERSGIIL